MSAATPATNVPATSAPAPGTNASPPAAAANNAAGANTQQQQQQQQAPADPGLTIADPEDLMEYILQTGKMEHIDRLPDNMKTPEMRLQILQKYAQLSQQRIAALDAEVVYTRKQAAHDVDAMVDGFIDMLETANGAAAATPEFQMTKGVLGAALHNYFKSKSLHEETTQTEMRSVVACSAKSREGVLTLKNDNAEMQKQIAEAKEAQMSYAARESLKRAASKTATSMTMASSPWLNQSNAAASLVAAAAAAAATVPASASMSASPWQTTAHMASVSASAATKTAAPVPAVQEPPAKKFAAAADGGASSRYQMSPYGFKLPSESEKRAAALLKRRPEVYLRAQGQNAEGPAPHGGTDPEVLEAMLEAIAANRNN